jgi:hypothetical protein
MAMQPAEMGGEAAAQQEEIESEQKKEEELVRRAWKTVDVGGYEYVLNSDELDSVLKEMEKDAGLPGGLGFSPQKLFDDLKIEDRDGDMGYVVMYEKFLEWYQEKFTGI